MHCQLLVPDLFWPERDSRGVYDALAIPALEQILAKGRRHADSGPLAAESGEAWLCAFFGLDKQLDWPVAPYSLLADGGAPGGRYWLRADPVHLQLESGRLVLADGGAFSLSQQEADSFGESLNAHFSADGLMFHAPRPDRWYLRIDTAPALETTPLRAAVGRSIDGLMPRGPDAQAWCTRLNEVQMLLHGHPVNAMREGAGAPPINSVWLWGGGTLSAAAPVSIDAVWSQDPFAAGLAQAARVAARDSSAGAAGLLRASASEGVSLIVLDQLRKAAQYDDAHGWREALQQLERDWFAPLLAALRQERIGMLSLHGLGPALALSVETTRGDLRRFWRRVKPLPDYAQA
ncbi:MAG: phosphoglycerate mutase [Burkholderiales bacterium]|nr:phosphoglycerate mutase [Burkholderiales bacterium]